MITRWRLYDPKRGETLVFERNPNVMASPHPPKGIVTGPQGAKGVIPALANRAPYAWQFSGRIPSAAMYAAFLHWGAKKCLLQLTDHFGRTFEIRIDQVDFDELRPHRNTEPRFDYTVKATLYRQVS